MRVKPAIDTMLARKEKGQEDSEHYYHYHLDIPDICHKHHKRCLWRKNLSCGENFPYDKLSCGEVSPHDKYSVGDMSLHGK